MKAGFQIHGEPARQGQPYEFTYMNDRRIPSGIFHSHTKYEMFYFHEGACTYLIGDRFYALKPGDLLLMNGLTLHCPHLEQGDQYVRSIIHFEPDILDQWLSKELSSAALRPFQQLSNYRLRLAGAEREEFEVLLKEMQRLSCLEGAWAADRKGLRLAELLLFVAELCTETVVEQGSHSEKERHVQHVITFVEQHYDEPLTLDEIAKAVHLSKPYLSAIFKEVTGTTVLKYVYSRRINQAKILLWLHPDMTVTEAGRAAGFNHLAHFSRMFKEMVGASPEEYRSSRISTLT
ncbi:helix-turn-helix transcriptional regulator [Paenibacillus sp. F411]|uniref:helix-turn-helix transcriptional regulator n=1 Tax=Paenibacillus sp. F411 TaxID=2820239 RepID=UPI001AAECF37|nr:helix-turn-helix domain-containing protein [Paenibacillus sp. F411]MBO2943300.1 helix-turn-helix transcriptional regulator [Paenibacillus sp. F411]